MSFLKKHRNDIILVAVLLLLSAGAWLYMVSTRQTGGYVEVTIDGKTIMELPLNQNTSVILGDETHKNTLVIENGQAYISEASCPDHVCIRQGSVSYDGQTIACLPNKLVVAIRGGGPSEIDADT